MVVERTWYARALALLILLTPVSAAAQSSGSAPPPAPPAMRPPTPAADAAPAATPVPATTAAPAATTAAPAATTAAPAATTATPAAPAAAKQPLPSEEAEVNGTCATPRQAWLQLLYWLQKGTRWKPALAAACFDTSGLPPGDAKKQAGALAVQLKEALDASGALVSTDKAPTDPNYADEDSGLARYEDPAVAEHFDGVYVARSRNGRWLFSRDTLERIPGMESAVSGTLKRILPDWARHSFLGVELWSYLGILALIFVAMLVQKLAVFIIGTYARRLMGHRFKYLGTALRKADRPIGGLAMALVFRIGFPMLLFPIKVSQLATIATQALAAYSGVWLAYRLIDVLTDFLEAKAAHTETKLDDQLVPLVSKTLKVFVSVVGGIFVLQNLDVDVGSLLAGLGLGGLAFALAAKDTVANFFGSVMIFIDKPFQIGDWIVMQSVEGIIEEVGFRTSRVRTFYNSVVTVPNSLVVNSTIDNWGRRQYRRYITTLGLTYDTTPDKVQAFCEGVRAIISGLPGMRKDYYMVEFKDFGASALEIMVYCFMVAPTWNDEMRTRTRLNLETLRLAQKLGVSFAFPTQTVHIETLPQLGEARPSHGGPKQPGELIDVVEGFGPGGGLGHPKGVKLSPGYYCDVKNVEAGDGGGEG